MQRNCMFLYEVVDKIKRKRSFWDYLLFGEKEQNE